MIHVDVHRFFEAGGIDPAYVSFPAIGSRRASPGLAGTRQRQNGPEPGRGDPVSGKPAKEHKQAPGSPIRGRDRNAGLLPAVRRARHPGPRAWPGGSVRVDAMRPSSAVVRVVAAIGIASALALPSGETADSDASGAAGDIGAIVPADRRVDWAHTSGVPGGIPEWNRICAALDAATCGTGADGVTERSFRFGAEAARAGGRSWERRLPAGKMPALPGSPSIKRSVTPSGHRRQRRHPGPPGRRRPLRDQRAWDRPRPGRDRHPSRHVQARLTDLRAQQLSAGTRACSTTTTGPTT